MEASAGFTKATFRVLYLGSDSELIGSLKEQQTAEDFQLVTGADAGGATLFLESQIPYRLLLIDFEWRGGDGLQLAQLAASLRHRKRMSIILIAAKRLTSRQEAGAQSGRQ